MGALNCGPIVLFHISKFRVWEADRWAKPQTIFQGDRDWRSPEQTRNLSRISDDRGDDEDDADGYRPIFAHGDYPLSKKSPKTYAVRRASV